LKKFKRPFSGAHAGPLLRTLMLLIQGSQQNLLAGVDWGKEEGVIPFEITP